MTIRIVLIDDHPIVRTGIAGMLANAEGIDVVGEAANGIEALAVIERVQPDVLLVDLRMPEMDGTELISRVRATDERIGIIVLTTYDSDADILRSTEAGANGYLLKDTSRDELIAAITSTYRGEGWLAPSIAAQLMKSMRTGENTRLSSRELEVLSLVAEGNSNKEIATMLHVSQATVKTHLIHIFRKLDVSDRTAAVTVALDRGILSRG